EHVGHAQARVRDRHQPARDAPARCVHHDDPHAGGAAVKLERKFDRKFEQRTPELRLKLEGWRSRFVLVLAIGGFAVLLGRASYLQALDTGFLQAKGEARYARVIDLPASRGPVKDRNGQLLAVSTAAESIWAIPDELDDVDDTHLRSLAHELGIDVRD